MSKVEFTILFNIELKRPSKGKRFIFTHFDQDINIAAYVEDGDLYYGIIEGNPLKPGITDNVLKNSVKIPVAEYYDTPIVLTFDYSLVDDQCLISAAIDLNKHEARVTSEIEAGFVHKFFSLGGSPNNDCFEEFKLFETVAYNKKLTSQENKQLTQYFYQKEKNNYLEFRGNEFMYRDFKTGHLVQDNPKHQPKYIK